MTPNASSFEPTHDVDRDADAEHTVGAEPAVPTGRPADPEVPEADAGMRWLVRTPGEATPDVELRAIDQISSFFRSVRC